MARTSWVGKAQAIADIWEAVIPSISAGQRIGLAINNKSVSYTAVEGDTTKTAAAGLASAWNASTEPEHTELSAAANGDRVRLTGDAPGVPHTITSDSTGGVGSTITITRLQGAVSAVNQKQYVELPGSPSGGTWKLGFYLNSSSSTIAYNASAATLETHLVGLSEVGAGNVSVSGDAGGPYTIEFQGDLAGVAMEPLQVDASGLTLAASDVTTTVDVTTDQLENVMAWEIDRPSNGWLLKQGSRETWILSSDATLQEIEQAVTLSLNIGSVRAEDAEDATGTETIRIYRQGEQARIEPDVALTLVTFTDDAGTAGRTEAAATVYQQPDDTLNNYVSTVRFRPRIKVTGKAKVNGQESNTNVVLTDIGTDSTGTTPGTGIVQAVSQAIRNTGTNEVQEVSVSGATGGTFTLIWTAPSGTIYTTAGIAYNATASAVKSALEDTDGIDLVNCTGGPMNTAAVAVEFDGIHAGKGLNQMTIDGTNLTGGGSEAVTTTTEGAAGNVKGTVTAAYVGSGPSTYKDTQVTVTSPNKEAYGSPLNLEFSISSVEGVTYWADITRDGVLGKDEVHKITIENATGGTYTLTNDFGSGDETTAAIAYNATAATVETAIEALTSVSAADISVYGNAGGPYTLVWGGAYAATAVDLMTATSSLTNSPAVTLSLTNVEVATGPNHFDAAKNWSGGAVPSTGDTLVFRDTDISLLHGLSQASITPAAMEFHETFTGSVGLPDANPLGYPEYRDTSLRIGQASDAQTNEISVRGGSSRIRLDSGDCPITIQISDTGITDGNEPAAFRWTGTAATNTVVYLAGSAFLGDEGGATAAIATLRVASRAGGYGQLELATGLTVTTLQHTSGEVFSRATLTTANIGGTWTQDGGSVTTLTTLPDGNVRVLGSPTITTLDVGSDGSVNFGSSNAPTATTTRLAAGAELLDPQGSVTFTNGIELVLCGLADVSLDVGQSKTLTIA